MANFNRVLLVGNLTRDPELRVTPKGSSVCQFGFAVNRVFKDAAGESREEATYVEIEAWGRQGETISKYVTKGRALLVEGRLRYDSWEDKNTGQKRSRLSVVLESFQFLGGRGDDQGSGGSSGGSPRPHSSPPAAGDAQDDPGSAEPADDAPERDSSSSSPASPAAADDAADDPGSAEPSGDASQRHSPAVAASVTKDNLDEDVPF